MAHYATKPIFTNKDETRELMAIWPDIVRDITDSIEIPEVSKWMAKVSMYNIYTYIHTCVCVCIAYDVHIK